MDTGTMGTFKSQFSLRSLGALAVTFATLLAANPASAASQDLRVAALPRTDQRPTYIAVGDAVRSPIGWVEFCRERPWECDTRASEPRDVRLTTTAWRDLVRVNSYVNDRIEPTTDKELYGKEEYWTYPIDKGDCEDYVLLKRRMLLQAGWPREALLITVVRDLKNEGHAVLTVRTDRGEFVLDNQNTEILLWHETGYRFVKRQSQSDPNVWVALGDNRPRTPTVASERR